MSDFFKSDLQQRKQENLYRKVSTIKGIDFTSNDYLNLSQHSYIRKKMILALEQGLDLGAKASRLLGGTNPLHLEVEMALKKFINRSAVLSFSSGYQTNLGLIPALAKERKILSDELNHASLIDGIRLSGQPYSIFRHNDLNHLESLLRKDNTPKLIVTESLFSMTGDFCPLEDISSLACKHNGLLLIDEAHSTGLFGTSLGGRVSDLKQKNHIITVHTGGKALGSSGAFVGSSLLIKKYLINNCRSFIYTTAPLPLLMAQWLAILQVLKKEKNRALSLRKKSLRFRKSLSLLPSESPIIPIVLQGTKENMELAQKLRKNGFFLQAIRPPTVPHNIQGLRIILHFQHSRAQLTALQKKLQALLKKN